MMHRCNVQCHTVSSKELENLGIEDSGSKWMPFLFDMGMVTAAKLSNDEEGEFSYNCTSLYTKNGDTFIIDTPYEEFFAKLEKFYREFYFADDEEEDNNTDDLSL